MAATRVLVCGSNYGAAYVRALRERPDIYQFAGLLARGSPRSQGLAERHRVPLWTTVEDVPRDIDLACAAMGHATFHLVLDLLRRGVHVLLEHPALPDEVERGVSEASRRGVSFHINTLFPALDAPRAFIDECRARPGPPLYLDVLATDRSLYAVLDILRNSLGMLGASTVPSASGHGIESFEGTIGGVPVLVRVQRAGLNGGGRLSDGAAGYLVDCRVTAWFDDGALTLLSVSGPVVWNGSYRRTAPLGADAWRAVHAPSTTYGDLLDQQTRANLEAIDALRAQATEGISPDVQYPDHLLDVARAWEHIARQLAAEPC